MGMKDRLARLLRLDGIAKPQFAAAHDCGTESTSVRQRPDHVAVEQLSQVTARLAQLDPSQHDFADPKLPADEVIQRDAAGQQIPTRLAMRQGDVIGGGTGGQRLLLDQGHLPFGLATRRAAMVPHQPLLGDRSHRVPGFGGG